MNRGPASLARVEGGGANLGVGFRKSRKGGKQALCCDAERNKEPLMVSLGQHNESQSCYSNETGLNGVAGEVERKQCIQERNWKD